MVSILKWAAIATALFVVAATVYEYIYEGGSPFNPKNGNK